MNLILIFPKVFSLFYNKNDGCHPFLTFPGFKTRIFTINTANTSGFRGGTVGQPFWTSTYLFPIINIFDYSGVIAKTKKKTVVEVASLYPAFWISLGAIDDNKVLMHMAIMHCYSMTNWLGLPPGLFRHVSSLQQNHLLFGSALGRNKTKIGLH